MNLERADALLTAILAGSLIMERLVTIAKTLLPGVFGDPGADPEASARWTHGLAERRIGKYRRSELRRLFVLALVLSSSFITAYLLRDSDGRISYAPNSWVPWSLFALLISGGSAFWAQLVGFVSAAKDFRAQHAGAPPEKVFVVDLADKPRPE